jgi:hypothetical protein
MTEIVDPTTITGYHPSPETLVNWAEQIVALRARARDLSDLADRYAGLLRQALGDEHTGQYGERRVVISRARVFDPKRAAEVLDETEIAACTVATLSPELIKASVSPERWDRCRSPRPKGTVRVS